MRALLKKQDASANSQLSQLRRGDFFRLAPMPLLRIKAGDRRLPFVFWDDVYWEQVLSPLRRRAGRSRARTLVSSEMSALQD